MKRMRKAGVTDPVTGERVPFPRLTHPRAGLSQAEWRALPPWERIERQLGMSLYRCHEILSWPRDRLDAAQLAVQHQVMHVVMMIGAGMMFGAGGRSERGNWRRLAERHL
jgi:hypothetical protein